MPEQRTGISLKSIFLYKLFVSCEVVIHVSVKFTDVNRAEVNNVDVNQTELS